MTESAAHVRVIEETSAYWRVSVLRTYGPLPA